MKKKLFKLISKGKSTLKRNGEKLAMAFTFASCYGILSPIVVKADAGGWADDVVNTDNMDIQTSFVDFIGGLGKVVGVIMAGIGIFVLVQAFRNEDVDGKHRGGLYLGIAAAMFALKSILEAFLGG